MFAVSEAIFPIVPTNAMRYGIRAGGTSLRHPFKRDIISPDSSQRPIPSVMVITRPSGAKPVKFFTILLRNQSSPSAEKKFWETTVSPDAGLIRLTPGYGCDRTDNRCEKEEPAEQDYRIGKFVTYVFDYGQCLVEPGLFCCSIGVFAHTENLL